MSAWAVRGVELPFGTEPRSWWIDASGAAHDQPLAGADPLPGRYVLSGLVDAHAHPAVAAGAMGPVALDTSAAHANLIAWARAGITLVRDAGSPGGVTLELPPAPGRPMLQAAGRFLAPAGRYYPALLDDPVAEADLVGCALAEVDRGAAWVKVIAAGRRGRRLGRAWFRARRVCHQGDGEPRHGVDAHRWRPARPARRS